MLWRPSRRCCRCEPYCDIFPYRWLGGCPRELPCGGCHRIVAVPHSTSHARKAPTLCTVHSIQTTCFHTFPTRAQVRSDAEEKLKKLQQEIAAAEAMGPAQVQAVQSEVAVLQQRVEQTEALRASKMQQVWECV